MEKYFEINKDVWVFFKHYHEEVVKDVTDSTDWIRIYEDAEKIYNKYNNQYCKDLVFAQLTELESIYYKNNGIKRN